MWCGRWVNGGGTVQVELAEACVRKVIGAALGEVGRLVLDAEGLDAEDRRRCGQGGQWRLVRDKGRWRQCLREAAPLCRAATLLGAASHAAGTCLRCPHHLHTGAHTHKAHQCPHNLPITLSLSVCVFFRVVQITVMSV